MPIYEYRCASCGRNASLFFRSLSAVVDDPACPHCGQTSLKRRMSRFWSHRSSDSDDNLAPEPFDTYGDVPLYGGDMYGGPEFGSAVFDSEAAGDEFSEEDVAAFAREARMVAEMSGEPLDEAFDTALRHIEHGADPDEVFGELDAVTPPADDPA